MGYSPIRIERDIMKTYNKYDRSSDGGRILAKLNIDNTIIPLSENQLEELENAIMDYKSCEENTYYCHNCGFSVIDDDTLENGGCLCLRYTNPRRKDLYYYCDKYKKKGKK